MSAISSTATRTSSREDGRAPLARARFLAGQGLERILKLSTEPEHEPLREMCGRCLSTGGGRRLQHKGSRRRLSRRFVLHKKHRVFRPSDADLGAPPIVDIGVVFRGEPLPEGWHKVRNSLGQRQAQGRATRCRAAWFDGLAPCHSSRPTLRASPRT